ncbi:primosomal protein N' (replication factor Y) - superfamily II helicase [Salipiger sp. IMCC34102]|uniref:primosomal protein N' (replication factor Y) - superfamily II helicase n=1 Tax=Salipiger sp. IMCC34102 TaxID=2510647 RepID=UPI00101B6724|nr:primosomal protein N' (replication factor Y) - superfamily II helicase [Salipiger sp. IMCC34102]RYH01870.1 primosomal protein N' (replication factor Y) - superfamily II helicase [Salipiger sp. IMCC34102]
MPTAAAAPPFSEHRFPCPNCGSDMRFDPGSGDLVCHHCGHREDRVTPVNPFAVIEELDFEQAIRARLPQEEIEETRVTRCPSCGAQVELGPDTHAAECPFCATPVVTDTGTHRHIKPKGVLPFSVSEDGARVAMTDWLGSLWFAPNGLKQYARRGRRMDGIYVPYWTFDANTTSRYAGQRGDYYYVTRTVQGKDGPRRVRERRIRWTPAQGRVKRWFDDVLALGSTSLPRDFSDGLEPWDLSALEPYRPDYLAGFRAEGYQIDLGEARVAAERRMEAMIVTAVKFDIGGDTQRIDRVETAYSAVTFKHILLPVWLAAYKYNGKSFRFAVNGQTGRVQGERPYSAWKIAFAVLLGLVVALGVGYLYAMNQ